MKSEIEELYLLSKSELEIIIGNNLLLDSLGGKKASNEEKRAFGAAWISEKLSLIAENLCSSDFVIVYLKNPKKENLISAIIALSDYLVNKGTNVVPLVAAVLIVKYFIQDICDEY